MDLARLAEIRAELEQDRDQILEALSGMKALEEEPLVEMLTASLQDLERALEKLETGDYGRCEDCQGPVGELRLSSLPASRLCLRCEGVPTDDLPA